MTTTPVQSTTPPRPWQSRFRQTVTSTLKSFLATLRTWTATLRAEPEAIATATPQRRRAVLRVHTDLWDVCEQHLRDK